MAVPGAATATLLLALLAAAVETAAAGGANPIRKVVTLLQDMQKEIEAEGVKEKELFDKFMCFCQGNTAELEKGVADAQAKLEELSGKLKAQESEKAQLELDVVQHKKDLASAEADLSKADAIRKKESSEYEAESGESKKNIDALGGAVQMMSKGMGGELLMQVPGLGPRIRQLADSYAWPSEEQHTEFTAFLENKGDYVPQGGEIVGMLKAMKDEMESNLAKAVSDEDLSAKGFAELKETKDGEIGLATEAIKSKQARAGELAVTIVQTQDDIDDTDKELADTQKFLAGLKEACPSKQQEWDERSKTRNDEVTAISEAINTLNDDDALEVFKKAVPSSLAQEQPAFRYGFLQRQDSRSSIVQRAQALLDGIAQNREQSTQMKLALYTIRSKLRHQARLMEKADFGNVTGMVDDMIVLEGKEQGDDDHQKPWCNGEFEKEEREEAAERTEVAGLEAEIQEESDLISTIDDEVATLKAEIEELDKSVAQATEQRKQEHAEYQTSSQLMRSAVQLIGKAKNRLQKFYNPSLYKEPEEEPTLVDMGMSFVQVREHKGHRSHVAPPEMPETFGAYEKKDQKSGGVMALMDTLSREIEAGIKDAEHDETTSQKDYVDLMEDCQETRTQNVKSITNKETAKADLSSKKTVAKEKEQGDLKDIDIIQKYVRELHGECDFIIENYDIRKEARGAEIESLKNAKAILAGAVGVR